MATSKFQKGPDLKRFMVSFGPSHLFAIRDRVARRNRLVALTTVLLLRLSRPLQDKRLKILLNGNRKLIGTLRGYDAFLNVVLEDVEKEDGAYIGQVVVRGNSVVQFEALERVK